MTIVNVHEAKTHLSRLLEAVAAGEEIIIAKAGKPIAKLVPIEKPKREPGRLKGLIQWSDTFFDPLPEDVLEVMENGYKHDPLRRK
ncbi:MAG: type II toxin-antitoxin system Phd/YefM family antitoxin [Gammaproteobacteria bacterium]